jgi:hypothetical protein
MQDRGSETVCRMEPSPAQQAALVRIAGKTVTRRLTDAELAEYQPLFDNARKLRALLSELQDLTLEITGTDTPRHRQSPEPETHGPENAGTARLTRGQPSSRASAARTARSAHDSLGALTWRWSTGNLMPQNQDLGVLGTVGAGEQGKPAEHAQHRQVGESQ